MLQSLRLHFVQRFKGIALMQVYACQRQGLLLIVTRIHCLSRYIIRRWWLILRHRKMLLDL